MFSNSVAFVDEFKRRSDNAEVWKHPYFRNKPTACMVKAWLMQAGPFEAQYPKYLKAMLQNPRIPRACHPVIQENLHDELGGGNANAAHFELFKGALNAVGVSIKEYEQARLNTSTANILDSVTAVCSGEDPVAALSFITQVELFTPPEYSRIIAWFESLFPQTRAGWEAYFTVHIGCDEHHFAEMAGALFGLVGEDPVRQASAFNWQNIGINLDHRFYDELQQVVQAA